MLRHYWRCTTSFTVKDEIIYVDKYKIVIYLYYYEDYSSDEIARMLRKKESILELRCFWIRVSHII